MTWLAAGLNDSAWLGLLEKRAAAETVGEVLAGMVGRTGAVGPATAATAARRPCGRRFPHRIPLRRLAEPERGVWQQIDPMLEQLILDREPGTHAYRPINDPAYLAAKLWLAQTRRPTLRLRI